MTPIYFLLALQVADLLSTVVALRNPRLKEANGPLNKLMSAIGVLPALLLAKSAAMGVIWYYQADIGQWLIALCVLYAVVVANNVRLILKA